MAFYKISFRNVVKGRVGCNIFFSTSLRILGESPGQSVRGSKCSLLLWQAWHFFNSRQGYASSGVYNINGVLRSSFEFFIGFRTLFKFWIGFGTGRYVTTHNLISKPHSVPPYTPYTTELVVQNQRRTATTSCERHQSKVTL